MSDSISEIVTCPSCQNVKTKCIGDIPDSNVFSGRALPYILPGGRLYKCTTCGLYFRYPQMSEEKLNALYKNGNTNNWQSAADNRKDWAIAAKWIKSKLTQGRLLDIGCFDGRFLPTLGERFEFNGIEIHEEASERARLNGYKIVGSEILSLDALGESFDAVFAFDVIEHVKNPLSFLKSLVNVTRPAGYIVISTGNTEALSWRIMGSKYGYCTAAEHISFINPYWASHASNLLNLNIEIIKRFSRAPVLNCSERVTDLCKNIFYKISPKAFAWLRIKGIGNLDVSKNKRLAYHPPVWGTSKDHFIVIFKKK